MEPFKKDPYTARGYFCGSCHGEAAVQAALVSKAAALVLGICLSWHGGRGPATVSCLEGWSERVVWKGGLEGWSGRVVWNLEGWEGWFGAETPVWMAKTELPTKSGGLNIE